MNVKRLHLDWKILIRGLEAHFPPGCWGFHDHQFVYVPTPHEIRVPVGTFLWIKGKWWRVCAAEFLPHVATEKVELRTFTSP